MLLNLDKLIEMQRELDNKIREEKGLQNADLVANTYVALQVELAEFANEARWFKYWSENQEPNTECVCELCEGRKNISALTDTGSAGETYEVYDVYEVDVVCPLCEGYDNDKNPLLEEYVDSLHFFLSLAIQKGWEKQLYVYEEAILDLQEEGFDGGLSGVYLEMIYYLNKSYMENNKDEKIEKSFNKTVQEFNFNTAWFLFIAIGLIGFDFSWEQIFQAYLDKNKVNHERQENGY